MSHVHRWDYMRPNPRAEHWVRDGRDCPAKQHCTDRKPDWIDGEPQIKPRQLPPPKDGNPF